MADRLDALKPSECDVGVVENSDLDSRLLLLVDEFLHVHLTDDAHREHYRPALPASGQDAGEPVVRAQSASSGGTALLLRSSDSHLMAPYSSMIFRPVSSTS